MGDTFPGPLLRVLWPPSLPEEWGAVPKSPGLASPGLRHPCVAAGAFGPALTVITLASPSPGWPGVGHSWLSHGGLHGGATLGRKPGLIGWRLRPSGTGMRSGPGGPFWVSLPPICWDSCLPAHSGVGGASGGGVGAVRDQGLGRPVHLRSPVGRDTASVSPLLPSPAASGFSPGRPNEGGSRGSRGLLRWGR